jgi:hypothetical protein
LACCCEKPWPEGGLSRLERIRYERELGEPLRAHFTGCGFQVRSEVNGCDLIAVKAGLVIAVEMKRHLSFDLLAQAVERQSYADVVYLGVPKPGDFSVDRQWRAKLRVLRQLGLGLLLVGGTPRHFTVEEALAPGSAAAPRLSTKKRRALEREFRERRLDLNTGGTSGVPLVTAHRECAIHLAYLLDTHGPMPPRALRALGAHPKRTASALGRNSYGWFARVNDRCYALTDDGKQALVTYGALVRAFAQAADRAPASQADCARAGDTPRA